MKKLVVITLIALLTNPSFADERTDITAFIKELDYLIEVSEQMRVKYGRNTGRVRFNYSALTKQLRTTRARTAEYLNSKGETINSDAPRAIDQDLIRIK